MRKPKKSWMNRYVERKSPATPNDESAVKRPVQQNLQHADIASQSPILASMLSQTPRTASVSTSVYPVVLQLPQEQLPKNRERKLLHNSYTGVPTTSTSSATNSQYSFPVQGGVDNILSTSLQQEVVTANSRDCVTLAPQNCVNFPQSTNFHGKVLSAGETCSNLNLQNYGNSFSSDSQSQQSMQAANINFDGVSNTNDGNAGGGDPLESDSLNQESSMSEERNIENSAVLALIKFLTDDGPIPGSHLTSAQGINEKMANDSIGSFMSCEFPGSNAVARNNLKFNQPSSMSMNMQQNQIVPSVNFPQSTNSLGEVLSAGETCSNLNHQNYGNSLSSNSTSQQSMQAANIIFDGVSNTNDGNAGGADPLESDLLNQLLDLEEEEKERKKKRSLVLDSQEEEKERKKKRSLVLDSQEKEREKKRSLILDSQGEKKERKKKRSPRKRQKPMNDRQPIPDNILNFVSPVSFLFPDGMNDVMNNIVAPTVSLQRSTSMPEPQLSPRYSNVQVPVASAPQLSPSQLSPGQRQQPPFSPMSQQGYQNNYPQSRLSPHLPSQPGTNQAWVQQRANQNPANLQQQNPMLNAQLSQPQAAAASFGNEIRFANQQPQFVFRSIPSPGSRHSPYSNPPDFPFHPPSPGIVLYQQQVQTLPQQPAPVPQQRLQRTVSIPNGQPFSQSLLSVAGANDNQPRPSCPRMNCQACVNAWQPVPDNIPNFQSPGSASFPVGSNNFMYNIVHPNLTPQAPGRRTRRGKKHSK